MRIFRDIDHSELHSSHLADLASQPTKQRASWRTANLNVSPYIQQYGAPIAQNRPIYGVLNSVFDVVVAGLALVLLAPLFILIAIAIKVSSPGPVMFRQDRYGRDGKIFRIFKFRTMSTEACDQSGINQTVKDDPRVTAVGRILRKTSFDELPQLFNILKREMSIVGPRPHVPGMIANGKLYEDFDQRYMLRHQVRPGLTGLAQVNGFRGETNSCDAAKGRLEYDLMYIEKRSFALDVEITMRTFVQEFITGSGY